jgi:hypothetical protein
MFALLPCARFPFSPRPPQTQHAPTTGHSLRLLAICSIGALLLISIAGGTLLLFHGPAFPLKARAAITCPDSSTPSPITGIQLNEVLTTPQTDWNKDGRVDKTRDQWIELANLSDSTFHMPLQVCDSITGEVLLPATLQIPAHGFFVLYGNQFTPSFPLAPGGGQLVLLDGDGFSIDSVNYAALGPDLSYSRNAGGAWAITGTPTPGAANVIATPGSPTPTPTATSRTGKGGSGGGNSGGKATPTATPFPVSSIVLPGSSALASQPGDSGTDSAGSTTTNSSFPAWLKITLLVVLGGGLLAVIIWYIRSWSQEPEGEG